jgi:hypothetical protein
MSIRQCECERCEDAEEITQKYLSRKLESGALWILRRSLHNHSSIKLGQGEEPQGGSGDAAAVSARWVYLAVTGRGRTPQLSRLNKNADWISRDRREAAFLFQECRRNCVRPVDPLMWIIAQNAISVSANQLIGDLLCAFAINWGLRWERC